MALAADSGEFFAWTDYHMTHATSDNEVVVAFGVDANYAPHLGVVLASIIANAPGIRLRVLVLNDGIPEHLRDAVERCAPHAQFDWHDVSDGAVSGLEGSGHISRASYYRLMIPEIAPVGVNRVIYLDVDLVVIGDLRELWNQDLLGMPIGAVADPGVDGRTFARRMNLPEIDNGYFNAGVLVIDTGALGSHGFRPAIDVLMTRLEDCPFMDQDALNVAFQGRWTPIDYAWNMQRVLSMRHEGLPYFASPGVYDPDKRPKIIHFTTEHKPWHVGNHHRFIWKYYQYLKQTPFWQDIVKSSGMTRTKALRRRIRTWLNWQTLKP